MLVEIDETIRLTKQTIEAACFGNGRSCLAFTLTLTEPMRCSLRTSQERAFGIASVGVARPR